MLPKDFHALYVGYNRKINNQSSERRRATYINILPHVQKLSFEHFCRSFWPIETDKVIEERKIGTDVSHETFEQIMRTHNKKLSEARRNKKQ